MSSDEQNVAQIGKELLNATGNFTGYQIAIAETDDALMLPAVVVTARHEEDTLIYLYGKELKRYSLTLEVRGIQRQDNALALDATFDAIENAFHPATPQTVPSAVFFRGIMIDIQTGSNSDVANDARERRRVYDLFAVEAGGVVLSFGPSDVNPAQNRFQLNAHGLVDGDPIKFVLGSPGNALPTPFLEDVFYFVVNAAANLFQVAATSGGVPIVITDSGTGTNQILR